MSITLNSSGINQLIIGGVTIETDSYAAVTSYTVDFQAGTLTATIQKGTTSGSTFTPGIIISGNVQIVANLVTGAWFVNGSSLTGTLSANALSTMQSQVVGDRNLFEVFAVGNNIMPGTQTTWSSSAV